MMREREREREIWGVLVAMGDGGGADIGQDSHGLWGILWGHALEWVVVH